LRKCTFSYVLLAKLAPWDTFFCFFSFFVPLDMD